MKLQTITHSALVNLIASRPGTTFVGIDSLTDARAKKTGNPFPNQKILKQARFVGTIGADYEAAVQRESGSKNFESKSLPWGEWEIPNKLIIHKGERYIRTQTIGKQRKSRPAVVKYRDSEGKFLSKNEVAPFLPAPSFSSRQEDVGLEETAAQVQPRNFKLSSILRVRVGGRTFKVIPD
jgi:hypothetical protein